MIPSGVGSPSLLQRACAVYILDLTLFKILCSLFQLCLLVDMLKLLLGWRRQCQLASVSFVDTQSLMSCTRYKIKKIVRLFWCWWWWFSWRLLAWYQLKCSLLITPHDHWPSPTKQTLIVMLTVNRGDLESMLNNLLDSIANTISKRYCWYHCQEWSSHQEVLWVGV